MPPGLGLEIGAYVVVGTLPVSGDLNGVELDLGDDDAVLLGVVFGAVQPEECSKAVVLNVLEALAPVTPFLLWGKVS